MTGVVKKKKSESTVGDEKEGTTPGVKPSHMIRVGKWKIKGYRWQVPLLAALPPNMALDSMDVELKLKDDGPSHKKDSDAGDQVGIHFIAKGKYYVLN